MLLPLSRDREREGGDHTIGVCAIPDAGNRLNDVSGSINTKKNGKRLVVRDQNKRILALAETHEHAAFEPCASGVKARVSGTCGLGQRQPEPSVTPSCNVCFRSEEN